MNKPANIFTPVLQRRLEGLGLLLAAAALYGHLQYSWTVYALCFFLPDLSILLYIKGPKIGGVVYNFAHILLLPLLVGMFGVLGDSPVALQASLIWTSHMALDRVIGWGLKFEDSFCNTDMGVKELPFSVSILK